jgi:hypothetical protein
MNASTATRRTRRASPCAWRRRNETPTFRALAEASSRVANWLAARTDEAAIAALRAAGVLA